MNELTTEKLAEIKDYCAKATAGPWFLVPSGRWSTTKVNGGPIKNQDGVHVASLSHKADKPIQQKEADGKFITSARTDILTLIAEIESLWIQREVARLDGGYEALQSALSAAQKRISELERDLKEAI